MSFSASTQPVLLHTNTSISPSTCGPLCQSRQAGTGAAQPVAQQITDFFSKLFDTHDFPARWHCGNWTDFHGWLYILSDLGIWAAYFAIPILLVRLIIRRKDVPFQGITLLFLAFVLLCGLTHLIDAVIFWWPAYRLSAILRLATAIVSVFAAYALNRVFPLLLNLRSVKDLKIEIAKRKRTEERLLASEFLLTEAGRIACVGGWEWDVVTGKRSWSKTVYDILEVPTDADVNIKNVFSYYPEPYNHLLSQAVENALENGCKWDLEAIAITAQNKTLWIRHIGEPVYNQQGKVVKLRGTLMDIDQYKKHELELSRALKATQEKTRQLQNFSYVLSHNIRNHTSNLSALAEMIEVDHIDHDNKDLMLKSKRVTQALTITLDDLANVMEAQEQSISQELVSFATVADQVTEAQNFQLQQIQAEVMQHFEVPAVYFSQLYMNSIFQHLLSNAIRYRDPAKNLQVQFRSYRNEDGRIVLECQDNGLGMDLELYGHKVFGLYATFHPSLSARGVGLYLIKTQIESQGGQITVDSQPGNGSTFRVVFNTQEN
ncbi:hypothetical protein HH214_04565 [Mucilaginibacter robiniae]|uniref:histidine kinase n=1 Tax=Mucilaginibacter robiniae TaxID=2728022 RepID=A0A7L5DWS2_9SPHI|nr:ATP-binding protein [Mucilaginibacter robiniae]QJD95201.1 hypothetical protein HH214_04565 [Mucilaginibacter robiniae]